MLELYAEVILLRISSRVYVMEGTEQDKQQARDKLHPEGFCELAWSRITFYTILWENNVKKQCLHGGTLPFLRLSTNHKLVFTE